MSIQQSAISADLEGQVITFWAVVYHKDSDCVYPYFSWDRVVASIDGSLRTFADCDGAEAIISQLTSALQNWSNRAFIPITVTFRDFTFTVDIYRWELDHTTPLFRILSKCYDQVDSTLKVDIMGLLSNPAR